jgi:acetylornithine deacetylase/succinyl-diaminopimelate desuccinylase-like protein
MSGQRTPPLDVEALLEELCRIDSRNPDLADDSPGERRLAERVGELLRGIGADVRIIPVIGERANVIGILPGIDSDAVVVLEAHLDTVPATAAAMRIFRDGRRLHGRGTSDTKGCLAAMIVAADALARRSGPRPTIIVAGVCDEEYIMRGALSLAAELPAADAVVIGEPTSLIPARAHNGFIRTQVVVVGEAAHSSRASLGVNAIERASLLVQELDRGLGERRRNAPHPLAGHALLSATMVDGGIAPNVIPDRCSLWFDRRVAPDETPGAALAELHDEIAAICARHGIQVELPEPLIALGGLDTPEDSPVIRAAELASAAVLGRPVTAGGVTYSTDACTFGERADLPVVVLGPGSIDQAHVDDEWIDLDELVASVGLYCDFAMRIHEQRMGVA